MEQDRENRRKERGGKIMKTLEQEVLKKIAKKSLFVKLVNTERNESLVEQSISKEFLDLSAVVRVVLKMDKEGMSSMALSNKSATPNNFSKSTGSTFFKMIQKIS